MKCVCGYYKLEVYEITETEDPVFQEETIKNNGKENFIKIKGSFFIEHEYRNIEVSIYACPKCQTLQFCY